MESPGKTSKVRFHDEVRVKEIKSRGKGNPVSIMKNGITWEEEEEEEEDEDDYEFEDDGESDDENEGELDEGDDDDEGTSNEGEGGRETIERLKDDLFAENEEVPSKGIAARITIRF